MIYTFDIPIDLVFLLFFVGGFIAGFLTLMMCIDYAKRREKYFEKHNCMGIRKPTPPQSEMPPMKPPKKGGRKSPPLPEYNPSK